MTDSLAVDRHLLHPAKRAVRCAAVILSAVAAVIVTSGTASAQSSATTSPTPAASAPAPASGPDLQGLWDFTMRVGDRTSPGFFALGPVENGWAGSITMYLTNSLAIRSFTVVGDSVRMVVASREGDVRFNARLTDGGRTMEGIVDYHGGARLPMTATRRASSAAIHAQATADEKAIIAVADSALAAITRGDVVALTDLMIPEAVLYPTSTRGGVTTYRVRTREAQRAAAIRGVVERGFAPRAMVNGGVAMVWLPYDLYVDGAWSHCGADVFTLVKSGGAWRIAAMAWSAEQPPVCEKHPDGPPAGR